MDPDARHDAQERSWRVRPPAQESLQIESATVWRAVAKAQGAGGQWARHGRLLRPGEKGSKHKKGGAQTEAKPR